MALSPGMPRRAAVAHIVGATSVLLGLMLAGVWVYPPFWGSLVYVALFLIASLRFYLKASGAHERRSQPAFIVAVVLVAMGSLLGWQGVTGRIAPAGDFIDLASPLPEGEGYCALSAGASVALNLHYIEGEKTAAPSEKHSVDLIQKNEWGFRTVVEKSWDPKPLDPLDYAVFGAAILAPCDGQVIESVDGKPDQLAGHRYRSLDGANLVMLRCEGADVLMAHFERGSVKVKQGDSIATGQIVGRVGNSGNTEEPHLHIHAQRTFAEGKMEPVPMRFGGRYLARGDCL
ncbi:M23 family metallopeptidase [Erythrobacter ani]|uniref:Peptidoglycan DD-metalloendopeptidase family protein n=1 Tax=Erythrobacter ani TaxID=2827235 RepID=A0ABS6SSF0_9SPHN|nr:M23 family metallopeptidase [Erythrobacter ani]MBV7267323.1 peptidoglycan DD-metalloendopeptidase family protein [Erythrobacter ani]